MTCRQLVPLAGWVCVVMVYWSAYIAYFFSYCYMLLIQMVHSMTKTGDAAEAAV